MIQQAQAPNLLCKNEAAEVMNYMAKASLPFVFIIDYEMIACRIFSASDIDNVLFDINGYTNSPAPRPCNKALNLKKYPIDLCEYAEAFEYVSEEIHYGNSFLLNLSFPTPIDCNLSLPEIYHSSQARYRLLIDDRVVVFSPETFVKIKDGVIYSHPMKGTIDASIKGAQQQLLLDEKETAEHATIVDLIRNDLSMVARNVRVDRYKYMDLLKTSDKDLYQMSSQLSGKLPSDYTNSIGDIITRLLPAGSISGAPKKKTVDIIAKAEGMPRGYYTGVVGYYDGQGTLDSGVMIRYIHKRGDQLLYRSGCGITHQSVMKTEYQEMIDKVYVPIL